MPKKWRWGVPDWSKRAEYPHYSELTDRQWWWEFLRRRQDYREAWLKFYFEERSNILKNWQTFVSVMDKVGLDPLETLSKSSTPDNWTTKALSVPRYWCQQKFGLIFLIDPSVQLSDENLVELIYPEHDAWRLTVGSKDYSQNPLWFERNHENYRKHWTFDLRKPLNPQIDFAKKKLKFEQKRKMGKVIQKRPGKSRINWPTHLRVLDARYEWQSFETIGRQILGYSDQDEAAKRGQDASHAAERLQYEFPVPV